VSDFDAGDVTLPCAGEAFPVRISTNQPFGGEASGEAECSDLVDCSRLARQAVKGCSIHHRLCHSHVGLSTSSCASLTFGRAVAWGDPSVGRKIQLARVSFWSAAADGDLNHLLSQCSTWEGVMKPNEDGKI